MGMANVDVGYGVKPTSGGPIGAAEFYDHSARDLFARMTVEPTPERKAVINILITDLKVAGVWNRLRSLWVLAAHDSQAARLNWIGDEINQVPVSSPTFITDLGYKGDGVGAHLAGGSQVGSLGRFGVTDASMGAAVFDILAAPTGSFYALRTGNRTQLIPRPSTTNISGRLNSGSAMNIAVAATDRFTQAMDLTPDALQRLFKDGQEVGTPAAQSSAAMEPPSGVLGTSTSVAASFGVSAAYSGLSLGSDGHLSMYNALRNYLQAVGAV